jgi:hypothetical protein
VPFLRFKGTKRRDQDECCENISLAKDREASKVGGRANLVTKHTGGATDKRQGKPVEKGGYYSTVIIVTEVDLPTAARNQGKNGSLHRPGF